MRKKQIFKDPRASRANRVLESDSSEDDGDQGQINSFAPQIQFDDAMVFDPSLFDKDIPMGESFKKDLFDKMNFDTNKVSKTKAKFDMKKLPKLDG